MVHTLVQILFLDIIHRLVVIEIRPVYFLKHNVSETGICLRLQVKPTQLGRTEFSLRKVVFWKINRKVLDKDKTISKTQYLYQISLMRIFIERGLGTYQSSLDFVCFHETNGWTCSWKWCLSLAREPSRLTDTNVTQTKTKINISHGTSPKNLCISELTGLFP
jgi:hypothetical protein